MRLPAGDEPRGYRTAEAAKERPEIGRVQRRSIQLGLLVALLGGFVPFVLALLTWPTVDVACSRASARDLSCTVVTEELFSRKTVTLELVGATRFEAFDVTRGSGKQRTKTQLLQARAHGAVVVLAEHPHVTRLQPPLEAFLADPTRPSVQATTGRSVVAYLALLVWVAIVVAGLSLSLVGGTTVFAAGKRPVLVVARRFGPGLSTRREVPLALLSHRTLVGGRPRNPLRLVLQGGEEVFLYLATEQEKAELAALIARARAIHADGHDSPTPRVRARAMPRRALGLLFFALTTSTAWAGVTPAPSTSVAPSSSTKAAAREAFMAGMKLYEAGDHAGALSKFSEAWALIPVSTVRLNIARCQEKLGRTATAWAEYKAAAADAKAEGKAKVETQANDGAAALEPKVPWLTITVTPSDALVKVDGESVASGVASPVDPGARVVTAQKGAKSKKVTVVVAEGDKKKIAVAL